MSVVDRGQYYIYRHIRLDKDEPFYIGMGEKKIKKREYSSYGEEYSRAFDKIQRNRFWHFIVDKVDYEIEILLEFDDFRETCNKEIELIKLYGRRDLGLGTLVNLTDGGDTSHGFRYTKEQIERLKADRQNNKRGRESNKSITFYQYDLDGNFVKECRNIKETSRELGYKYSAINAVLIKDKPQTTKSIGGFQWFKNYLGIKVPPVIRERCQKPVYMIDKYTDEIIKEFNSPDEARKYLNTDNTHISSCARGNRKTACGYKWRYKINE